MGGQLKSPLFNLQDYRERMQVSEWQLQPDERMSEWQLQPVSCLMTGSWLHMLV
jgi:hypothetical protein